MEHGYEKILEVQRRCEVSFEEADRAMRACKGDVDKACTFALRRKRRQRKWVRQLVDACSNFLHYRIRIRKGEEIKFDIPMWVVIVISFVVAVTTSGPYNDGALGFIYFVIFAAIVLAGYTLEFRPKEEQPEPQLQKVKKDSAQEDVVFEEYQENTVESEDDGYTIVEIE